jgi:hypothetical protein
MARLVGESGPVAGKEWKIDPGLTLGREAHNSIGMPDNRKASRDHAKVWREGPGRYAVADLGSTNGTLVNDERVTRHALADGDEVRVGEATFRFLLDEDEKPKKKEGPARVQELLGGKGAPGAPGAGAVTSVPTMTVKERVLQYRKKSARGPVTSWDLSQASGALRWGLIALALGIAAGLFFLVKNLIAG